MDKFHVSFCDRPLDRLGVAPNEPTPVVWGREVEAPDIFTAVDLATDLCGGETDRVAQSVSAIPLNNN
jgi:hypothetical protein